MYEQHQWESQEKVSPPVFVDIFIEQSIWPDFIIFQEYNRQCAKNNDGDKRIENVSSVIRHFGNFRLYFPSAKALIKKYIKDKKSDSSY